MKVVWPALAIVIFTLLVSAQSVATGEIRGRVVDATGATLPEARVEAVNADNGLTRVTITSETGEFRLLILPPGRYDLKIVRDGFATHVVKDVLVQVGEVTVLGLSLALGAITQSIEVAAATPFTAPDRFQQSNLIVEEHIRQLPIDRRDFLAFSLLVPGVVDSVALSDANDFRVVQSRHSGLSFFGSNGRGNNITIDGGETNTEGGGVRSTLSQEAVQEFQINRSNFSAELGGASGGVINIVSKSGTNDIHGSAYAYFRHHRLDAADPFARTLIDGQPSRIKPPSERQQFGGTFGGPLKRNRVFVFAAFEGQERDESSSIAVLNDLSIFEPTPEQEMVLARLPVNTAAELRNALTSPESTREFFRVNSGLFRFRMRDYKTSLRLDQNLGERNRLTWRYNYGDIDETNPNLQELRGFSRGIITDTLEHTAAVVWTAIAGPRFVNDLRAQFNYRSFQVSTNDKFGPEININGFGFFNRDYTLPNSTWAKRFEIANGWTASLGHHIVKVGGQALVRGTLTRAEVFFGGRFTFGALPGSVVNPELAGTTLTALQAFNLGLPQTYQQAFGEAAVGSTDPTFALYVQDNWKVLPNLTVNYGLRYELDDRRNPLPTDKNNFAPRVGFAWNPGSDRTTLRGGYGIFYAPHYYQVDWVVNALNEINGKRQIAQVLTTLQTAGAANAGNVFRTLRSQGVLTFPQPSRSIAATDVAQFGITFPREGPLPPLSVLFRNSEDFVNSYSQQASLGFDRLLPGNVSLSANYIFARTLKIVRARDDNLLPAPVDPTLGIPVWSTPYFKRPALLQENVYESTGRAFYHGLTLEVQKRFGARISVTANYTLSKAIDEVVDFNSDFQANNQLDLRAERALSSFDQRHKVVLYGVIRPEITEQAFLYPLLSNFTISPIVRANSGRPFNLLVGFDLNGDRHPTTDRPAGAGRNTGIGPDFWTVDLRVAREARVAESLSVEFIAEAFNLLNRLNFQSVNNVVGNIAPPFSLQGNPQLSPSQPLGFTSAAEPRRVQLGVRLRF